MKRFTILLLLPLVFLIAVCQPVKEPADTDDVNTDIASNGVHRHRRTLKPTPTSCSVNQYFDKHEGRCLGVVGGGKVLYINDTVSCDTNTLKPHCTNPRYYYICKKDKIILAQCTHGRHFENRLQKCVHVSRDAYVSATVNPKMETFNSFQPPECETPGSFPLPNDCAEFYVCETNGHRLHQNFFRCPENTAYDRETEMCVPSDSCEGSKNLPSICTWSIHKERLTIEEAEKWLNIWPLNDTRFLNSVVNVSKNFTLNKNGSVTICETISVTGESNTTATNIYETPTSTQSSNDVATTDISHIKPRTSVFAEVTDNSDVITSTKRDTEMSRSSNTIDSTSTEAYSAKTDEPTFMKEAKQDPEVGDGGLSSETSTFAEPSLKEKVTEVPTSTTEKETEVNTETNTNEPLSDMTTMAESALQDHYSTTGKVIQSSSTEATNIHDDPTVLPKKEMPSNAEMNMHNTETSTNGPLLEITTSNGPVSEDQYSTIAPQTSLDLHTDPTISNKQKLPSTTEKEMEANTKTSANEPLLDITTMAESVLQDHYSTTEKVIQSSSTEAANIHDGPTVLPKKEMPSNTEMDMHNIETSTNEPFLGITTSSRPLSEDQYSTVAPQTSLDLHTDPTISNKRKLPSTTEKEMEANTEASANEPLSDMTTVAESVLQEQYSTTEKVTESSSSKVANIHDDSTVLPKKEMPSNAEMDMHNTETSTSGPFLETTTLSAPLSEDQHSTPVPQKSLDPQFPIHTDPTISNDQELPSNTEMDMHNIDTSTNEPFLGITTSSRPLSEDQYSTVAPQTSLDLHTDPTISNKRKLPSTTEKEVEANTEASANEPLSDMTTLAGSVLQDQYSSTENMVVSSSSEVPHIHVDPTISADPSIFSSTETSAQNTIMPTESVSSSNNAAYLDTMTSTPKNDHEFREALTSTQATFVVNDTSSSTVRPNLKTANETSIDNAVPTSNVAATTESPFLANETSESTTPSILNSSETKSVPSESESTTMKPITSPEELITNCMALSSANSSSTSIQPKTANEGKSSSSANNETYSKSFDMQQHSHVTDKDETKENVARKGIRTSLETEHSERTISKHVVLPIASAVLNITDNYERRLKYSLRNYLLRHAQEHKKHT